MIRSLDGPTENNLKLRPDLFAPVALENVKTLYVEGRTDLAQFEEDVAAILAVMDAANEDLI